MTTTNELAHLACGVEDHGGMDRMLAQPTPPLGSAAFTLWICQLCGVMALHLETPGDIYWYRPYEKKDHAHMAGCAYCSAKFACACGVPSASHMCPGCDAAAEESKMGVGSLPSSKTNCGCTEAHIGASACTARGPRYPEDLTAAETIAGSADDF